MFTNSSEEVTRPGIFSTPGTGPQQRTSVLFLSIVHLYVFVLGKSPTLQGTFLSLSHHRLPPTRRYRICAPHDLTLD